VNFSVGVFFFQIIPASLDQTKFFSAEKLNKGFFYCRRVSLNMKLNNKGCGKKIFGKKKKNKKKSLKNKATTHRKDKKTPKIHQANVLARITVI